MKISINKTVVEEIEIQLPVYRCGSVHVFKIYSDEKCVQVCSLEDSESIEILHSSIAYCSDSFKDCTKEEFEIKYLEVNEIINSKSMVPNQKKAQIILPTVNVCNSEIKNKI